MTPDHAKHLMLAQERLELAGWHISAIRPASPLGEWAVIAAKGGKQQCFWRQIRSDALGQALQWACMEDGSEQAQNGANHAAE